MPRFHGKLPSRLPEAGTTIFTVMSAMARQYNAINLSQGFPDFEVDPELNALVYSYMKKGCNQYAPMQGVQELREAIASKVSALYHQHFHPETEINICSGATQAIFTAILSTVHPGDEVIILEPAYDCYAPAVQLAGGKCVFITLEGPEFHINWDQVRNAITPASRMIIINSPHNPSGSILTTFDLNCLSVIIKDSRIIILSDEVYEHILFDKQRHESVLDYPELASRSFVVFSFGKTYHATGWKIGYCLAPAELMAEFRKVHQFLVFSTNTPFQYALAEYMKNGNYLNLPAFYEEKRNYFLKLIQSSSFSWVPAKGSYFQLLAYEKISSENDLDFAKRLTKEHGVAAIPLSPFYKTDPHQRLLRFCFAKKNETLERAAEKLCLLKSYD